MSVERIDPHAAGVQLWSQWLAQGRPATELALGAEAIAARLQALDDPRAAYWRERCAECRVSVKAAALAGETPGADPLAGFVTLCRLCFAIVPVGAILFAAVGLDEIIVLTRQPATMNAHDMRLFKAGVVVIGLVIFALGEAILRGLPRVCRRNPKAGSALVSALIAVGLCLTLAAWALVL